MSTDLSGKIITVHKAKAEAVLFCKSSTLDLIKQKMIPEGDVFEFARTAGFFGAKNTSNLIPNCYRINIESLKFEFDFLTQDNYSKYTPNVFYRAGIVIKCIAEYTGRTGIQVEAITAVSIAAITIYDMLKYFDDNLEISCIRLLEKS